MTDDEFNHLAATFGFAPSRPLREMLEAAVKADGWWSGFREAMRQCAAAIRARGKE